MGYLKKTLYFPRNNLLFDEKTQNVLTFNSMSIKDKILKAV